MAKEWNANIHYYRLLLDAIPKEARRVLEVGCGDGLMAGRLIERGVREVVALDSDADVLARAKARNPDAGIEWVQSDFFDYKPAGSEPFDAVVMVATLHHMDAEAALRRLGEFVRPGGGVVGVVGLAANDLWDWPMALVGVGALGAMSLVRGYWEHSAPIAWPPPTTYREIRGIAQRVLPGVRYRRHLYQRYSLVWRRG